MLNAHKSDWNCDVYTSNADTKLNFISLGGGLYRIHLDSDKTRYMTATGTTTGSNVNWQTLNESSSAQKWRVVSISEVDATTQKVLSIPSERNCNWSQFYSEITTALNSTKGCTIVTALNLMNYYGPSSYTITDALPGWKSGVVWSTQWEGNFRTRSSCDYGTSNANQASAFAAIRVQLYLGKPVIVNIGTGNNDSHTVMCYGYQNGGKTYADFLVMDPAGQGKTNTSSENGKDWSLKEAMNWSTHPEGIWNIRPTYAK